MIVAAALPDAFRRVPLPDLLLAGEAERARRRLIPFVRRMYPAYREAPHHRLIGEALESVESGDTRRLVITVPPRHGKSTLASEHFPPWFLGRNPNKRIIAASYAAVLAYRFSRRARNLLADPRWPFDVTTAGDLAQVQSWDLAGYRGGYVAAGVGGGIAGIGADLLLVDDPVRSAADAESATVRDATWNWYTSDAYTRLEPGGAVVLIGTRWNEDDLIGRALAQHEEGWVHLDLPAIAEEGDLLGRSPGDALWPERFGADRLAEIKATLGSRAFASLYQQRPSPAEGGLLKREWWRYWTHAEMPWFDWKLQTWDTAFKTGQQNDWSVCQTWGVANRGFYLLDQWRARVEFPVLKRAVVDQYARHRPDEVLIEDAASGQSLIQSLADDTLLPIIPFKPDKDKVARVNAVTPYVEAGRAFLPADAPWLDEFVEEMAAFPTGAHDDQVDPMAMAIARLALRAAPDRVDPGLAAAFLGLPR